MRFLDRFPAFAPALLLTAAALLTTGCGPSQREARHALADADVPFTEAEFAQRAGAGDRDTLQLFFDAGMALNATLEERTSLPLIEAASGGHAEVVEMLLERGADPNVEDEDGREAIIIAVAGDDFAPFRRDTTETEAARADAVKALLDAGADPNAVYRQRTTMGTWPLTALRLAAENGNAAAVRHLFDAGAEMKGSRNKAEQLLLAAAEYGDAETFDLLLERSDPPSNMTALVAMSCAGKADRVSRLLAVGVSPDAAHFGRFEGSKETALVCALRNGHRQVVKMLLDAGADPDAGAGYEDSQTALFIASGKGDAGAVQMLLQAGANVDKGSTERGETALGKAAAEGHVEIVKRLLGAGANPNGLKKWAPSMAETALQKASDAGNTRVVQLLKDAGAEK